MALNVLLIDDEEGVRRAVGRLLLSEGYGFEGVEDGKRGIEVFKKDPHFFDIVICDLIMPGIDGLKTLEEISDLSREVTKIILTGYGTIENAIRAIEIGVDGFITKPFENKEFLWKIKETYLKKKMRQFVSFDIFEQLLREPSSLTPKVSNITVLFSDIRNFTLLSSRLKVEEIAEILNRSYFSPLSEIIMKYRGMIDKYIGDSIMALFGAPVYFDDHALMAVRCAKEMMERIKSFNSEIEMGIGIATGNVTVGLFGSENKKEYTAFGMAVNIAARLQKLAKAGEILISEETKNRLNHTFSLKEKGILNFPQREVKYYAFLDG